MHLPSKLAALLLGLGLFSGGVLGASAQSGPVFDTGTSSVSVPAITRQAPAGVQEDPGCAADQTNDAAEGDTDTEREDPNDRDNVQDENGADDAQEQESATEDPNDTDDLDLQCGDQGEDVGGTGTVTQGSPVNRAGLTGRLTFLRAALTQSDATAGSSSGEQESATEGESASEEQESATEVETETGIDQETDGIACEQEGEHDGENAGC